jgi:hypothetical protein
MYDFRLDLLEVERSEDVALLAKFFKGVRLDDEISLEILDAVENGDVDGGWTISNFGLKRILVVLLKMRTEEQRRKVLAHEKRHVEDDILEHASVNDKEAAGYLAGYLGKFMY